MKAKIRKARFALFGLAICTVAAAYETDTHALMTFHSFDRSVLAQASTIERLGLDRFETEQPFHFPDAVPYAPERDAYFDYEPSVWQQGLIGETFRRKIDAYELQQFPENFRGAAARQLQLKAWLLRGAVREDDLLRTSYKEETPPDADPHGELTRVYHHFYDPILNRSLTVALPCSILPGVIPAGCVKATDWAMGAVDAAGVSPAAPDPARRNHFSYADAVEAEWCALTHRGSNPSDAVAAAGARRACWASSIKSLGQVLHLLQDTAQPQHVRNDRHNPTSGDWFDDLFATSQARRTYEIWVNYRATLGSEVSSPRGEKDAFSSFFSTQASVPPIQIGNYPRPMFSRAIEFFTTRASDADFRERRGLADFTNRNVYSEGSIFSSDYSSPPFTDTDPGLSFLERPIGNSNLFGTLTVGDVLWTPSDSIQPGFIDPPLQPFGGKIPLLRRSIWSGVPLAGDEGDIITLDQYSVHADLLIPRAISYGTGLIDYFFRGRLEVTPTAQKAFAVLNQGEPHTMDAEGYPRRPDGRIFGFEKLRLNVRNVSEAILESGPVAPALPQTSGNGVLVAVARFHRNTCYQPDLSGERLRDFAPPPSTGTVTEPNCPPDTTPRTGFQEIAVSAPLTIASVADLPGGEGVAGPAAPVEKVFDFSADPIPVNATDLFIQVVYRGALGEEPDGIALGSYDAREPAFVGIWNNTDYYWNVGASQWVFHLGGLFPFQNADFLRVCTGAAADSRFAWFGEPVAGAPILGVPVPDPGVVRLAMLFAIPASPTQQFSVRVTPVMNAPNPSAPQRSWFTRGAIHQAGRESIPAAMLAAPLTCADNPAATTETWCQQPVERRRGQAFGQIIAPVLYDTSNGNITPPDVDAAPALPTFPGLRVAETGTLRYNDAVLAACPPPPTQNPEAEAQIELLETAADLGIPID
ncbi:MAG: hypothetical protein AB7I68_14890 [Porticoccaceae bacterium]